MTFLHIREAEDGGLVFEGIAPWYLAVLVELPTLLEPEQPEAVKERLFPLPSRDEEHCEEWRKLVHPELFALLASAREVVAKDLQELEPLEDEAFPLWRLAIPAAHVNAWLSALNAARLALAARHGVDEDDMEGPGEEEDAGEEREPDERSVAVAKIHLLGLLQHMILEARYPPPEDDDGGYPATAS